MTIVTNKSAHWCYADYASWPEEQRWELIDGQAYSMAPAPSVRHQKVIINIIHLFKPVNKPCHVLTSPIDVLLPTHDESDDKVETVVQPDVLILCDNKKVTEQYIRGAPNLVVEVLSPATAKLDEGIKRDLYERAGVEEYWLIHPIDHTINRYTLKNKQYHRPDVYGLGDNIVSSRFPELDLPLSQIFDVEPESMPQPEKN